MKENTMWQRWMYRDNLWGLLLRLTAIAGVIYVLIRASAVFSAFVAALILAQVAAPLVKFFCRIPFPEIKFPEINLSGIPFLSRFFPPKIEKEEWEIKRDELQAIKNKLHTQKAFAVLLVFVLMGFAIYSMVYFFVQPFKQEWAAFMLNKDQHIATIQAKSAELTDWWKNDVNPYIREYLEKQWNEFQAHQKTGSGNSEIGAKATETLQHFLGETTKGVGHIVELILLPVLAFYFIVEGHALRKELLLLFPKNKTRQVIAMLEEGGGIMQNYLKAQVFLAIIAGLITFTLLSVFHVPYAFTLGLIAGVTRAVPVIGPLLGGIPVVGVALLQTDRPWLWVVILGMFTALHLAESKILMPKLIGHHLDLHAVIIILALLLGGEFFGLGGMFLAAPLAALARTLYIHYIVKPWERPNTPKRLRTRLERAIRNAKPAISAQTPSETSS